MEIAAHFWPGSQGSRSSQAEHNDGTGTDARGAGRAQLSPIPWPGEGNFS